MTNYKIISKSTGQIFNIVAKTPKSPEEIQNIISQQGYKKPITPEADQPILTRGGIKSAVNTLTEPLGGVGQFVGGIAGGSVATPSGPAGMAATSALGGTLGRRVGEIAKTRLRNEPIPTLAKGALMATGLPIMAGAIPTKALTPEEQANIDTATGKAGISEAVTAPLGYGAGKVATFLGRGAMKGLLGSRIAERGFDRGWKNLLNPEFYQNRVPKEIAQKTNDLFKKTSDVTGKAIDNLVNKKFWNVSIPTANLGNDIKGILPQGIKIADFAKSKAEEKLLTNATQEVMQLGGKSKVESRLLPSFWEARKNLDKLINSRNWGDDAYDYLHKIRNLLNAPIKSASPEIAPAFEKYAFVKNAEYDLGKTFKGLKGPSGEIYSPKLESFVSNLLSTNKDETIRLLKDIDKLNKAPNKVVEKLLDYSASEGLEKGIGFGAFQNFISGMFGGRKTLAKAGQLIQSPITQGIKKTVGRLIPTMASNAQ